MEQAETPMANPKEQMAKAKDLIKQKRYAEARRILVKIDSPTAREWLAKLDKIAPETKRAPHQSRGCLGYILSVLVSALVTSGLIAGLVLVTQSAWSGQAVADTRLAPTLDFSAASIDTLRLGRINASGNVNIRTEPAEGASVARSLPPGTSVTITAQSEDGAWYGITTDDGATGWIAAELLTVTEMTATPPPTVAATADTATTVATAVIVQECAEGEAQAWWESQRELYYQARYVLMQHNEDGTQSFSSLADPFAAGVLAFRDNQDAMPVCVAGLYATLNEGLSAAYEAMAAYNRDDATAAATWVNNAQPELDAAAAGLAEAGVTVDLTDCGAEYWLAGLAPNIIAMDAILDSLQTMEISAVRSSIFTLQDATRTVEAAYAPLCASNARDTLRTTTQNAVELVRAIGNADQASRQRYQTEVNNSYAAFVAAIQNLGLRLPGN